MTLAEALIEDQQSVFGAQAIEIAQEVDGLWVEESGEVAVCGDGKATVGDLAEAYVATFGRAAGSSLRITASEFDDLDLPATLQL